MQHALDMEFMLFGLTCTEMRKLAAEIAAANGTQHNFNVKKRIAGKDWFKGFPARHPALSVRKPEATPLARAQAFNRPVVTKVFETLESTI